MRTASLIVYVALGACGGVEDNPPLYIPLLVYPRQVTVTEGGSTSFVLSTSDFSHGGARGMVDPNNDTLTAAPSTFALLPSSSSVSITTTAAIDADLNNETTPITLYIYGAIAGESPVIEVLI